MTGTVAFEKNLAQMVIGARACLDRDLPMPALVLIYSLIDSFAWAVDPKEANTRTRFENWLTKYVYPASPLPCTPTELYAARCAVLHTLTSKGHLHIKGKLREIAYAWGAAKTRTLSEAAVIANVSDRYVGLHLNEFLDALTNGIERTFAAAETDAELAKNLDRTAPLHFGQIKAATVDQLLARGKGEE